METQAQTQPSWINHPFAGPKVLYRTSTMDPKQRFYRQFLDSEAVLKDQIGELESVSSIAGERQEAIDHILAGIAKLQNEVADSAEYTPAYDRKQYSESIKGLQEELNKTINKVTPKSRFQFKRTTKTPHVDMGAPENDPRLNPGSLSRSSVPRSTTVPTPGAGPETAIDDGEDQVSELVPSKNYNEEMSQPSESSVRKPSFSTAKQIGISNHTGLHIILPSSASRATAAGSLTDLKGCVVDMSVPTGAKGTPFPGLAMRDISRCLIVAGRVDGAVHITNVTDSVLVVTARQVRIHECRNVDIYLHCGSHPIIEDCSGMRFAPLHECYATEAEKGIENYWDKVNDFKWLKASHSPNWTTLSEAERLGEEIWTKVVPGQPGRSVEETLAKVGVPKS